MPASGAQWSLYNNCCRPLQSADAAYDDDDVAGDRVRNHAGMTQTVTQTALSWWRVTSFNGAKPTHLCDHSPSI